MSAKVKVPDYRKYLDKILDGHYEQLVGLDIAIRTGKRMVATESLKGGNVRNIAKKITQLREQRKAVYTTIETIIDMQDEDRD